MNSIKSIKYTYKPDTKTFSLVPPQDNNENIVHSNSINISVNPHKFKERLPLTEDTNNKWFINLSDTEVPLEVSKLLQLGNNFSLPTHLNKKTAIHEFIKDIESNKKYNIKQLLTIRNKVIPHLHSFLDKKTKKNITEKTLISAHKSTQL